MNNCNLGVGCLSQNGFACPIFFLAGVKAMNNVIRLGMPVRQQVA
ncbi:hypothetical protein [Shewanella sp. SM103]|nr:hypothetical protein [Shewanella sp. SM103]